MAQTLTWDAVESAASYKVYRATEQFDLATLPEDVQPTDDPTITYTDAVRQTVYWFVISSIDADGGETFGEIFNAGYFPESGPGSTELIRGDWTFGFFGEVPASELFTFTEIQQDLLNQGFTPLTPLTPFDDGVYFKVIVNGKILFIPIGQYGHVTSKTSSPNTTLNGYGYGNTGMVTCPTLTKNGLEFTHRLPAISNDPADYLKLGSITSTTDVFAESEASMLISLFSNAIGSAFSRNNDQILANTQRVKLKLGDYDGLAFGVGRYNTNAMYIVTEAGALTTQQWYSNGAANFYTIPVLELLF